MSAIVVSVDLRPLFGPARNQGPRPTCLAFAASDAHAALRPGWVPLSCEYAFYQAQRRAARPPSAGALLSSMLDALREDGQPEEIGWPYLPATPTDTASWVPPRRSGRCLGATARNPAPFRQIIDELDQGRPVIILTCSRAPTADNPGGDHPATARRRSPRAATRSSLSATARSMDRKRCLSATVGARAGAMPALAG